MSQKLAKILGIDPVDFANTSIDIVVDVSDSGLANNVQNDYTCARENIHKAIAIGEATLKLLFNQIATSPTDLAIPGKSKYDVMANLLKTFSELNRDLLDLTDKRAGMNFGDPEPENAKDVSGFIGSTTDALRAAREKRKQADNGDK